MASYKRESHARSLLKGISWRCVATLDTIVVGALVLYLFNDGDVQFWKVFTIAAVEFPLKYLIYYLHERVWERFRVDGETDNRRTLKKSISWRIVATSMTFVIALVTLFVLQDGGDSGGEGHGSGSLALGIAVFEFFSKFLLYYVHERIWARLPLGRIRNWLFGKKKA